MSAPAPDDAEAQLRIHLAAAVIGYVRQRERAGLPAPAGLLDYALSATASDRARQPATTGDVGAVPADAGRVLLVDGHGAARMLDCSVRSVQRQVAAGRLPAVRVPGLRGARFRPDDLRRHAGLSTDPEETP